MDEVLREDEDRCISQSALICISKHLPSERLAQASNGGCEVEAVKYQSFKARKSGDLFGSFLRIQYDRSLRGACNGANNPPCCRFIGDRTTTQISRRFSLVRFAHIPARVSGLMQDRSSDEANVSSCLWVRAISFTAWLLRREFPSLTE